MEHESRSRHWGDRIRLAAGLLIPQPFGLLLLGKAPRKYSMPDAAVVPLFFVTLWIAWNSALGYLGSETGQVYGLKISATVMLCMLVAFVYNKSSPHSDLAAGLRLAGIFHFTIVIFEFLIPDVKAVTSMISRMDPDLKMRVSYRLSGFFDGFDIAGVFFGICALNEAFYKDFKKNRLRSWFLVWMFFIGAVLCSRTGILISLMAVVLAALRDPASIVPGVVIIALCSALVYNNEQVLFTIYFMFDIVFNYIEGGSFSNASSRDLIENNWFMPSFGLFGDGAYPWSGGVNSDVGYVQALATLGLSGTAAFATLYLVLFLLILRRSPNFWWLVPVVAVASLKGAYFWSPPVLLLCALAASRTMVSDLQVRGS